MTLYLIYHISPREDKTKLMDAAEVFDRKFTIASKANEFNVKLAEGNVIVSKRCLRGK